MSDPYKFGNHNATDLLDRGKSTYGSKVDNSVCECPVCFGGKRIGMLNCKKCNGKGVINKTTIQIKHQPGERFPYKAYDADGVLLYEGTEEAFTRSRAEQEAESDWYLKTKKKK